MDPASLSRIKFKLSKVSFQRVEIISIIPVCASVLFFVYPVVICCDDCDHLCDLNQLHPLLPKS